MILNIELVILLFSYFFNKHSEFDTDLLDYNKLYSYELSNTDLYNYRLIIDKAHYYYDPDPEIPLLCNIVRDYIVFSLLEIAVFLQFKMFTKKFFSKLKISNIVLTYDHFVPKIDLFTALVLLLMSKIFVELNIMNIYYI